MEHYLRHLAPLASVDVLTMASRLAHKQEGGGHALFWARRRRRAYVAYGGYEAASHHISAHNRHTKRGRGVQYNSKKNEFAYDGSLIMGGEKGEEGSRSTLE